MKQLFNLMKGSRALYFSAMLTTIIASLLMFVAPYIIRITIDSIIGDKALSAPIIVQNIIEILGGKSNLAKNLWICALGLFFFAVFEGIFMYLKGKWSAQASESITENLRNKLYTHLSYLPFDYFVKAKTGDLVQRCSSDVETIRSFFAVQFIEVGKTISIVLIAFVLMFRLNTKLALASLVFLPFIFIFSLMYFQKIKIQFKICDEAEGEVSTAVQENLSGIRVVRAFAKEKFEIEKFDKKNRTYMDEIQKLINMFALYWSISDFLSIMQVILLLFTSTYLVINKEITLGTMIQFIQYQGILLWPIRQLGRILTEMGKALVAIERVEEILNVKREEFSDNNDNIKIEGDIEFDNVSFSYDGKNNIINNLSFKVKKGETLAILGATGSGKSTLVHLLPRLYDYTKGSIKIDGIELKDIDKEVIRNNIGIVLQEPFMFSKSIIDNMSLANKTAGNSDIFEATRVASIHSVINDFDKGYDTSIGEKGVTLSGGQKQRLAIARTLLKNPPILIFDDSLSAVDTETDKKIRSALNNKSENTTTIIISHRISTLAEADRIIVLDKGQIIQEGTHKELINKSGIYQNIWNIQNRLDDDIKNELENTVLSNIDKAHSLTK